MMKICIARHGLLFVRKEMPETAGGTAVEHRADLLTLPILERMEVIKTATSLCTTLT